MDTGKASLKFSPSPHQTTQEQVRGLLCDLLLALAPAALLGVVSYGLRALLAMAVCIGCGVGARMLTALLLRRGISMDDCMAAAYSCALCVFFFGAGCALWVCAPAGIVCALLLASAGAGSERRIFSPALAGYLLFLCLFPSEVGAFTAPLDGFSGFFALTRGSASILPAQSVLLARGELLSPAALAIGGAAGAIGASSALALAVGGVYLMLRRIADPRPPITACAVLFLLALLFPVGEMRFAYAAAQLLSGGFFTGALFFLFPAAGAPVSRRGQTVYAAGYAALCFAVRRLTGADGAACALLVMQAFSWSLDFSRLLQKSGGARIGARIEALLLGANRSRPKAEKPAPARTDAPARPTAQENEAADEPALAQEASAQTEAPDGGSGDAPDAQQDQDVHDALTETTGTEQNPAEEAQTDGADDGNERI